MNSYYPGKKFPSISITGERCALRCKHCGGRYLRPMIPAESPGSLLTLCRKLRAEGAYGFLLSGGFDEYGRLPISDFLHVIPEIRSLGLEINPHVGLVNDDMASRLRVFNVASVEVIGDQNIIERMYGLRASPLDYIRSAQKLEENGIRVVPHICAGLNFGTPSGEGKALRMVKERLKPDIVVITALVPTPGTEVAGIRYSYDLILEVIGEAVDLFPDSEIALGCMRPRFEGRDGFEERVVEMGVSRIALPSKARGERVMKCCAIG